jgi:hypothetical protein
LKFLPAIATKEPFAVIRLALGAADYFFLKSSKDSRMAKLPIPPMMMEERDVGGMCLRLDPREFKV